LTCLVSVEQSALQIVRNAGARELIDHCSLLVGIAPNCFSLSPVLIALDNRSEKKGKKACKLKKETKALTNEKAKDTNTNNLAETMFCGKEKTRRQTYLQKLC
jgi:hypothetical protein